MAAFAPKQIEACDGACIRVAATMKEKESVRKKEIKKTRSTIEMHQIWGKFGGQGIIRRARRVWG